VAHATYVVLGVMALATSTYYFSVSRSALLVVPAWILLAEWVGTKTMAAPGMGDDLRSDDGCLRGVIHQRPLGQLT